MLALFYYNFQKGEKMYRETQEQNEYVIESLSELGEIVEALPDGLVLSINFGGEKSE